jgi:hypothetical protein
VIPVKYPKLAAALDDLLSRQVRENGEDLIMYALAKLAEPVEEKKVDISVTKELVLSEQTEVRDGD